MPSRTTSHPGKSFEELRVFIAKVRNRLPEGSWIYRRIAEQLRLNSRKHLPQFIDVYQAAFHQAFRLDNVSIVPALQFRERLAVGVVVVESISRCRAMNRLRSCQPGMAGMKSSGLASSTLRSSSSFSSAIASKSPAGSGSGLMSMPIVIHAATAADAPTQRCHELFEPRFVGFRPHVQSFGRDELKSNLPAPGRAAAAVVRRALDSARSREKSHPTVRRYKPHPEVG